MKSGDHSFIVDELNELIEHAGVRPSHWHDFARAFCRSFPGVKVSLQVVDRRSEQTTAFIFDGWSEERIRDYNKHFGAISPWRATIFNMGLLNAVWTDDHLRNSELRKSEFYADMLRPEGECDSGTGIKLVDDNDRLAIFSVNYSSQQGEAIHRRVSPVLHGIAGPFRKAIETNSLLGRAEVAALTKSRLLDALCDVALVVDRRCRVIAANQMAQDMLAGGSLLRTDLEGRVLPQDGSKTEAFSNAVSSICNGAPGNHVARDLAIVRNGRTFRITFLPISPGQIGHGSDRILPMLLPARAVLVIVRPEAKPDRGGILQRRFGMTRTQIAIALAMTEGGALVDVAERLGMKYETARSHLKAIYNKAGVNKQSELVSLVWRLSDEH